MEYIAAADAVLHPAREEAFGMVVLEAMASGTPVVGGWSSGNVPCLLGGGCGLMCDVTRDVDVAAALAALLADLRQLDGSRNAPAGASSTRTARMW